MFTINLPGAVDELARQEPLVGLFLLAVGLMFLLMGLRLSRMVIGMSFGVVGFLVGASLPGTDETRIITGMFLALVLGGASLWARRASVAVLCGLWFALIGVMAADRMNFELQINLTIAAIMFGLGVSLAILMMSEMTAMVTSLEGTLLFVGGLIVIANQTPAFWMHLRGLLVDNSFFGPFMVISGTVIGFYAQMAELQKKQSGRSA